VRINDLRSVTFANQNGRRLENKEHGFMDRPMMSHRLKRNKLAAFLKPAESAAKKRHNK
jgi:hypothetical protein